MKRKGFVLLTVIALLASSGMALAQSDEGEETEETDDTVFNFAYDEGFRLLVLNISPTDGLNDCTLQDDENGVLNATYLTDDGVIVVDELTEGEDENETEVVFPGRDDNDEVLYSDSEECGLRAVDVTGPNGQVNHGMIMKTWNSFMKANYEGKGRGCLNRSLAQSNLGKDGQQVKVSDDSSDFTPVVDGDTGMLEFSTFAADCEHGNGNNGNNGNGNGHGNGSEAAANRGGRPDSPGKSGEAAGHNK